MMHTSRNEHNLLSLLCSIALLAVCISEASLKHNDGCRRSTKIEINCGKVPLYENIFRKSVNTTYISARKRDSRNNPPKVSNRIVNGLNSVPGEWPWIVMLKECTSKKNCRMCTGTLLNSRWVITAGHCVFNRTSIDHFEATLGLYNLKQRDTTAFDVKLDKIIVHPEYNDMNNDVALVRLIRPVKFDRFIQPACLVRPTRDLVSYVKARDCFAIGYGLTRGMHHATKLQKLGIVALRPAQCVSDVLNGVEFKTGAVCIGPDSASKEGSTCKGDSGGPNMCYDAKEDRWSLFGLTSYGPGNCDREPDESWSTVSADLTNYLTWIKTTISKNGQTKSEHRTSVIRWRRKTSE